ncbi:MAG: hypothetical protein BWY85_00627 [Firmicutes bacterium ADurb.Bin506]|nr:MAG: hypothetical protein BWY85_00627 [Firmicutes bacterium ADurb.Bin506]
MRPLAYRLRLAALLAICVGGGLLFGGLVAGVAKADPYQPDQVAINYTLRNGDAVCDVMDEYPSVAGVMGIVEAIVEDGLTPVQAGQGIRRIGWRCGCSSSPTTSFTYSSTSLRCSMPDTERQCDACGSWLDRDGNSTSDGCPYGTPCDCGGCFCDGAC